nr:RdRp [Melon chlorotic spot virus]
MNSILISTLGLTCKLTNFPNVKRDGKLIQVPGDGWCLLHSLAKSKESSPELLFIELIDYLRETIRDNPINGEDLKKMFHAYLDKNIWFEDTLIILFSCCFKAAVQVFSGQGMMRYEPDVSKTTVDLKFDAPNLQNGHYSIYDDSVGILKSNLWSDIVAEVEWAGTIIDALAVSGGTLDDTLKPIPSPYFDDIKTTITEQSFHNDNFKRIIAHGTNIVILLGNNFYVNLSVRSSMSLFLLKSLNDEYLMPISTLIWSDEDVTPVEKPAPEETHLYINPKTKSLDCSNDFLSEPYNSFKECYVGLVSWIFEGQLSDDILDLLYVLVPISYESIGPLNEILGIKVIFHFGHHDDNTAYWYNKSELVEYHLVLLKDHCKFLKRWNYVNKSDKRQKDLLLLRRNDEYTPSTFSDFMEKVTGFKGVLYRKAIDLRIQKYSISILKLLTIKINRNVFELVFLLRLLSLNSTKTSVIRVDASLDSTRSSDISLRVAIKKVGYSHTHNLLVIDTNFKCYMCSRKEQPNIHYLPTEKQKHAKKIVKNIIGIEIFPSIPNYAPNLVQYTPEPKNFQFPEPEVYPTAVVKDIPIFHIEIKNRGKIHVTFENSGSTISTYNNNSYILDRSKARTFIHDFTFDLIAPETDMAFNTAGLSLRDPDDYKTPDLIVRTEDDKFYIYEFATRRSSALITLEKAQVSKDLKYRGMIEQRSRILQKDIFYGIITATPQALQTNVIGIPKELCEELMFRMRTATEIFNKFVEMEIEGCADADSSMRQVRIESIFKTITMENMSFVAPFSKEMYDGFARPINKDDMENHTKLVLDCFKLSKDKIISEVNTEGTGNLETFNDISSTRFQESLQKFYDDYRTEYPYGATRTDMKPPVQLPFIYTYNNLPQPTINNIMELVNIFNCDSSNPHTRLISSCVLKIKNDEINETNEFDLILMDKEERAKAEKLAKKNRKEYRRVEYQLSETDEIDLATIGLFGRKYKDMVKDQRSYKKLPFDLHETEISDIHELLNAQAAELFSRDEEMFFREDIDKLLKDSLGLHNTNSIQKYLQTYDYLKQTKVAHWARFISDLGSELSISVKQFCKSGNAIFKKLKNYSIYLLIIPTGGPIFFSLLFPKVDVCYSNHSTVFKNLNETEGYYYTDFVSVNSSKLRNLVLLESVLYSTFMLFAELSKLPTFEEIDTKTDKFKIASGLTLLSLLICLDDKAKTEEACTLNRYVQMEGFVHFPKVMDQQKLLGRINLNIRSRLELFVYESIIECMRRYSSNPCRLLVQENKRQYEGMVIPYLRDESGLQRRCDSPEMMLNIIYIGYIKNKDENAEVNALGQLISKIIGWEDSVPSTAEFLGLRDPNPENIQKHEFNTTAIRVLTYKAKERLKKTLGATNPTEYIGKLILDYLKKQSLEQFSTLKASSNFGEKYYYYVPKSKSERTSHKAKMESLGIEETEPGYKRSKVIVKLKEWLDSKEKPENQTTLVVDLLLDALEQVEENMCLHVCIFKKNQHAGLREIYVLNIAERIIQKTVEDISRAILSCFPSETMTHPNNKYRIPEEQSKDARNNLGSKYVTYNTSDDAKKWNQGHYVTKFICMLVQFTPTYYHGFICRTLQLWLDKRIMLPVELISLFSNLDEMHTKDEFVSRLFKAYKGYGTEKWISKGQSYIKTSSGFMQGILHYTSSLFHTIILDFISETSQMHLMNQIKKIAPEMPSRVVVRNMQSSDDSSMMISVPVFDDDKKNNSIIAFCCYIWFTFKEIYSLQLGIYKSEKSTTMTQFIMEFNSEFQFLGEIQKPTIRWVYACCLISEQETLVARQEELSNTLKDVVEGGGSFILALYCQIAQLILHYRLLGSGVSMFWDIYTNLIRKVRDPALGYFLMDNNMCAGILGFNYNLWNSYDSTVLAVRYKQQSISEARAPIRETIKQITPDTLSLSLFTRLTTIRYGNKKIWERIMSNMNFPESIWDDMEKDPAVLYYGANDVDEVIKKMAIKMKAPGVVASLGSANSLVRIISTGVYIMSRSVVSTQSAMFDDDGNRVLNKAPLLQLLIDENEKTMSYVRSVDVLRPDPEVPETVVFAKDTLVQITDTPEDYLMDCRPDLSERDIEMSRPLYLPFIKKNLHPDDKGSWIHFLFTVFNIPHQFYRRKFESENTFGLAGISDLSTTKWDDRSVKRIFYKDDNLYYQVVTSNYQWGHNDTQLFTLGNELRKLLFPFEVDYQAIRHNMDMIDGTPMNYDPGHRRRTRSNLVIAGSESGDLFSLEEIAKYVWFRKTKPPLSDSVIMNLWANFKVKYPFLKDTVEGTLHSEDCPFPNHISLRNFIARQDKGSRVIHLTGSHGKHGTQHANLLTVIKNNTSDNYSYDQPIIDENKRTQHLNYETLMHTLSMLSEMPLDDEVRNFLMEDLLVRSPQVSTNIYALGGRRNKMSIIQSIIQEDPEMILSSKQSVDEVYAYYRQSLENKWQSYSEDDIDSWLDIIYRKTDGEEIPISTASDEIPEDILKAYNLEPTFNISKMKGNYIQANWDQSLIDFLVYKLDRNIIRLMAKGSVLSLNDATRVIGEFEIKRQRIVQNISLLKLGMIGGYTTRQARSPEGIYYGIGVWEGHFNNVGIKIEINSEGDSSFFTSICVRKAPSDVKLFLSMLKTWSQDHKVGYSEERLRPGGVGTILMYIYEGKTVKSYDTSSIPIMLNEHMEVIYNLSVSDFRVELTNHNLRLMAKVQNSDVREITTMQVKFTGRDINPNIRDVAPVDFYQIIQNWSPIISTWVKFDSLDYEWIDFFSRSDMRPMRLFPTESRLNWCTNLVRNSIYRLHLDRQAVVLTNETKEEEKDGLNIAITGMLSLSNTIETVLRDMPEFNISDIDFEEIIELLDTEDIQDRNLASSSKLFIHPFLRFHTIVFC